MWVRAFGGPRPVASARTIDDDTRLRALRLYGSFALAYSATFQAGLEYFGGGDGFLAYKQVGSTALVLSNPVAPVSIYEHLICRFVSEKSNVSFWQISRPIAELLAKHGFSVNEMGTEARIELDGYDFDGPRKRNFRTAFNRAARLGYTIAERWLRWVARN
jgi:lysylphosphatidylglycerol synthetase-like protein (DUF2156 family)